MSTETLMVGLRFERGDAKRLAGIGEELRSSRPAGIDISLFDKAAESAAEGEPLVVRCTTRDEVEAMAHWFARLGVNRPAIDELNGIATR